LDLGAPRRRGVRPPHALGLAAGAMALQRLLAAAALATASALQPWHIPETVPIPAGEFVRVSKPHWPRTHASNACSRFTAAGCLSSCPPPDAVLLAASSDCIRGWARRRSLGL
jgi:hypothetical protein